MKQVVVRRRQLSVFASLRELLAVTIGWHSQRLCDGRGEILLAEMREHPGGSELNLAMSAAVQPGSLRCSAFIERVPREHGWHALRLCEEA